MLFSFRFECFSSQPKASSMAVSAMYDISRIISFKCIAFEPNFIFLTGELPYPNIATPWALKRFLSTGGRMPRPDHCTEEL